MRIDRETFLNQLESVLPGLSTREIIEQSSCFIFKGKKVRTYNDEIGCTQDSCLPIKGAVQALPLVAILRRLKEKNIEITIGKGKLLIKGKRKRIGIRMETEILLPIASIEIPKKWKNLPNDFADAVSIVQECAGKDESRFVTTCIHLHPKWIEACDNFQASRYKIKMAIEKPTLVRKDSLKYIVNMDMTQFSETKTWIHFRNSTGLILSCRRWVEEYPDISSVLRVKGNITLLPKGLKEAIERAEVFSAEDVEENRVIIHLQEGKLKITGKGVSGWCSEFKNIKYKGQPLSFTIAPNLLIELVQRHHTCEIAKGRLKVKVGKFTYVTVLGSIK